MALPQPRDFPVPPARREPDARPPTAVPTWARRTAQPGLDPLALRRRLTLRAGPSTLVVDELGLTLRRWWRRTQLAWGEVDGFAEQLRGRNGRLVVHTSAGDLALPATRRPAGQLRELHAVLDAYRRRAGLLP